MDGLFEGSLVRLRPVEPDDAVTVHAYLNRPEMAGRRYVPWDFPELTPLSRGQADAIVQKWTTVKKGLSLAVVLVDTDTLIGHTDADWDWDPHCPTVAVAIDPAHHRQGYGSEAMRLLLRYLFDHTPAHIVGCWIADWNEAGLRFAARLGFRANGCMRRVGLRHGRSYDVVMTDMLRPEWVSRGGAGHAS